MERPNILHLSGTRCALYPHRLHFEFWQEIREGVVVTVSLGYIFTAMLARKTPFTFSDGLAEWRDPALASRDPNTRNNQCWPWIRVLR
jgi:hypothetical protein